MAIPRGTRIGGYEVISILGSGGMGEVYRARDLRLGRDVAVKVLPQHLSANPEVRARFEQAAAALPQSAWHDVNRGGDAELCRQISIYARYGDVAQLSKFSGGIGIDCGGFVIVRPLREWHKTMMTALSAADWRDTGCYLASRKQSGRYQDSG